MSHPPTRTGATLAPRPGPTGAVKFALLFEDLVNPTTITLAALLLVLGIVGLLGGWRQVAAVEKRLPAAEPGRPVAAAPLSVVALKAYAGVPTTASGLSVSAGQRVLAVRVDVTDSASIPLSTLDAATALRIDATGLMQYGKPRDAATASPEVRRLPGAAYASTLQPGVLHHLLLVWTQRTSAPVPSELTLTIGGLTYRKSSLDGSLGWFDPTPAATVTLPVEPLPQENL